MAIIHDTPIAMALAEKHRNIRLDISYKGTKYAGWQRQPNVQTVQGEIERALSTVLNRPSQIIGAGRTDSGVHAKHQVATLHTTNLHVEMDALLKGVNSQIDADIRVINVNQVDDDFHALKSARGKVYRYFFTHQPIHNVFTDPYVWHVGWPYDKTLMQQAMRDLQGEQDFISFATHDVSTQTTVRDLQRVELIQTAWDVDCLEIQGTGFLRHMVRAIMGTLMDMAQGRIDPKSMPKIIAQKDRGVAGQTAPAQGLFLWEVLYDKNASIKAGF